MQSSRSCLVNIRGLGRLTSLMLDTAGKALAGLGYLLYQRVNEHVRPSLSKCCLCMCVAVCAVQPLAAVLGIKVLLLIRLAGACSAH